ncbi:MAG: hypothetical protein M3R13_08155 [Armatimonadota bacterium]|nr:hypothetical protein [Armatimonadota bacterium]
MLSLHGVDIYIHSTTLPEPSATQGPMSLTFISDRGTRIFKGLQHDASRTDIYCARYESDSPITDGDIKNLLDDFAANGIEWPKVQKLFRHANGDKAYSQPY